MFNRWRRGDESIEQPCPRLIGERIEDACEQIERLERERDEARSITFRLLDENGKLERERDEAREQNAKLRAIAAREVGHD
jgi:hypothetical protein